MKKVLLSGIKPTGRLHIGNYFGAMRQFVELQDEYDTNIFIADLHALTTVQNPDELRQGIIDVALDYLAVGLDPKKTTLFKQSDVPSVTEAAWVFDCLTTMPYLMRAHAFKDAEAKNKEINVGVFNYPMLMAADILLASTDVVPVGKDQKQHVEIARDIAVKFNRIYGETFKIPQALIIENVESVAGVDGQKMSKSYNNTIPLFATDDEIEKIVMAIPTDSRGAKEPKDTNGVLFKLNRLFLNHTAEKKLADKYEKGISYKEAKETLITDLKKFITPLRKNRMKWEKKIDDVKKILDSGGRVARERVEKKLEEIREKIGTKI